MLLIILRYFVCIDLVASEIFSGLLNKTVVGGVGVKKKVMYTVVQARASWIGAREYCKDNNLGDLLTSGFTGTKFLDVRHHLMKSTLHENEPLWTGFIKHRNNKWFKHQDCVKMSNADSEFANVTIDEEQCVLLNTTVDHVTINWYATSCRQRHHFVCAKDVGDLEYDIYKDMELDEFPTTARESTSIKTQQACMDAFLSKYDVFAAHYKGGSNTCIVYKIFVQELPFNYNLRLTLTPNVTSYVKTNKNQFPIHSPTIYTEPVHYYSQALPCQSFPAETVSTTLSFDLMTSSNIDSMESTSSTDTMTGTITTDSSSSTSNSYSTSSTSNTGTTSSTSNSGTTSSTSSTGTTSSTSSTGTTSSTSNSGTTSSTSSTVTTFGTSNTSTTSSTSSTGTTSSTSSTGTTSSTSSTGTTSSTSSTDVAFSTSSTDITSIMSDTDTMSTSNIYAMTGTSITYTMGRIESTIVTDTNYFSMVSPLASAITCSGNLTPSCLCPHQQTNGEIHEEMESLKRALKLNKKLLSSYQRRLTCAPDERISSKGLGMAGACVIISACLLIVAADVPHFIKAIRLMRGTN